MRGTLVTILLVLVGTFIGVAAVMSYVLSYFDAMRH